MKIHRNIRLEVLFTLLVLFFSSSMKAQIDTAYIGREYIHQYIVPQLVDPTLENYYWEDQQLIQPAILNIFDFYDPANPGHMLWSNRIAQRYDIEDSISLCGVAVLVSGMHYSIEEAAWHRDTVRLGILDSAFNTIYEQYFIFGGNRIGNYWEWTTRKPFAEFVFDEIVNVRGNYFYAFLESSEMSCDSELECVTFFSYAYKEFGSGSETEYYSCGYDTKYRPYLGRCDTRYGGWYHVDEITDWFNYVASSYQVNISYKEPYWNCEPAIYPPAGIFPIRALENSSVEGVLGQKDLERSVNLYPNPAKGFIRVDSESNILKIEVYNVLNQLVETLAANSKSLTLDLKSYNSGTYFAKITTDLGTTTKKFVVE